MFINLYGYLFTIPKFFSDFYIGYITLYGIFLFIEKSKLPLMKVSFICLVNAIIPFLVFPVFNETPPLWFAIFTIVIYYLSYAYIFNFKWIKSLFYTLFLFLMTFSSQTAMTAIIALFKLSFNTDKITDNILSFLLFDLICTIYIFIIAVFFNMIKTYYRDNAKLSILSIVYVSVNFITLIIVVVFDNSIFEYYYSTTTKHRIDYLLIINLIMLFYCFLNLATTILLVRYTEHKNQLEQIEKYNAEIENSIGKLRQQKHNFDNILASLYGYSNSGELEDFKSMLQKSIDRLK